MPVLHLDSLTDRRLAPYRSLKTTNETRSKEFFIAEGERLLQRMLASDHALESVLTTTAFLEKLLPQVPADVPIYVVPGARLEEIVGFNFHRGVLAQGRRTPRLPLPEFLENHPHELLWVVCPDVANPENLGALIRNSSAFGVDAMLLGPHCADPFSRRVLRVSMGTVLRMPIFESRDMAQDLDRLAAAGVELAATVLDDSAERLDGARRSERFALLFGSEGYGLAARWVERCQRKITIPMQAGVDSLNVAVSAGIFLYHFTRPARAAADSGTPVRH